MQLTKWGKNKMPNWTFNTLKVVAYSDDEGAIKQFDEFVKLSIVPAKIYDEEGKVKGESKEDKAFTFEGVHPMPKDLMITSGTRTPEEEKQAQENLKKYGHKDWYDWSIAEWGTKWNASNFCILEEILDDKYSKELTVSFDTAWCPPMEWLQKATEKFPLIRFEMEVSEESDAFMGKPIAQYGKVCENITDINYPS